MEQVKSCYRCHVVKPLSEYHANRTEPDGKQHYCKVCMRAAVNASAQRKALRIAQAAPYVPDPWCTCNCPPLVMLFAEFDQSIHARRSV